MVHSEFQDEIEQPEEDDVTDAEAEQQQILPAPFEANLIQHNMLPRTAWPVEVVKPPPGLCLPNQSERPITHVPLTLINEGADLGMHGPLTRVAQDLCGKDHTPTKKQRRIKIKGASTQRMDTAMGRG